MVQYRRTARKILYKLIRKYRLSESAVLILLASIVGLATGFGAVLFIKLLNISKEFFFADSGQLIEELVGKISYWEVFIPAIGGLIVGPIVYKFAREAKGHGVPEVMVAVALKGGIIRPRVAIAKALASAICIGSGGSAGREGPIVQIGAAIGSVIGQVFKMSERRVKVLVGCGAAAGISAVFNAPIAGVIFSLEIILGDFAIKTFAPVILSSVVASVVSRSMLGDNPAFIVPPYQLVSAWEIPMYVVLGLICAIISVIFIKVLFVAEDISDKAKLPDYLKPAIGGLLLGVLAIYFPQVYADGYESVHSAMSGHLEILLLFVLCFVKIIGTSFTLGSGNSGGIFAPSLFMGAMIGGCFGSIMHSAFPELTAPSGAYALVGMAALVAGTTHAPITAILIVFEMTGDYHIILPVMVACVFSTLGASKILPESIYTLKLFRRGINLKRGKDQDLMKSINIRQVMKRKFITIPPSMPLKQIMQLMETTSQVDFPIVDPLGKYCGIVTFDDLKVTLSRLPLIDLVVAQDMAHTEYSHLHATDTLDVAMERLGIRDLQSIAVLDNKNERIIGFVFKHDLLSFYNRKLVDKFSEN